MEQIIFEDQNILIINKPRGLLLQQDGDESHLSLDKMVADYLKMTAMPAHRLDKDTSGLCVFAKNKKTADELGKIFNDHTQIEKHYITLVVGNIEEDGVVDAPLRKSFERKKMVVAPLKSGAKPAITKYSVIERHTDYTLLDVQLLTGRTHQIRAHMSYIRHHVVGDVKYGDYKINNIFKRDFSFENQFLHAYKLKFLDIKGHLNYLKNREFSADLPPELQEILKKLDN
ncbi:MAG: RluA family pseudouridine synthase [Bacilli bacterium]|nr:RluA family pseudouridine synthase [Bacilli bacterium]